MKKVTDFLKPNILIIFGALFLLYFLNCLSGNGATLAIGIIAVVLSAYYLSIGILEVLLGNKFSPIMKKIFEIVSVDLFAIFMFVYQLIIVINLADNMGPTGWLIGILSLIAFISLASIYPVAKFVNQPIVLRLAYLFSAIFVLALSLNILFDGIGNSIVLGAVDILLLAIYGIFTFYLFSSLEKGEEAPAKIEKKEEEKQPEEPKQEEAEPEQEAPVEEAN